jgi:hypothetical protein
MAGRDDFGSGMKSPGGWSGGGGGMSGGIGGAKSSGGTYNYSFMPGARPNTKAIGNWNTGGAMFGFGSPQGASDALRDMFNPRPQAPVQSGPIRPALGAQGLPVPNSFPPAELPPGMTLSEYYDSLTGTGPYIQKPTRPMAPNVYGQPPTPIGNRPPPPVYGPRSNQWTYSNTQNPAGGAGAYNSYPRPTSINAHPGPTVGTGGAPGSSNLNGINPGLLGGGGQGAGGGGFGRGW